jgi:hypothetical protein
MTDLITDEIVAKAVVARGSDASSKGIGTVTKRMLEAVAEDIVDQYFHQRVVPITGTIVNALREHGHVASRHE